MFAMTSFGNGIVIEFVRAEDGATVLLQGTDALHALQSLEGTSPNCHDEDVIAAYFP
ncbi:MAG: hypothetical protein FLDDKLPJ_00286 [Phycisphaerae bacterium]|nr:hypothetical protein [Phycisphaerae bacterium]